MFFSSPFVPSYQQYGVVCKAILIDECRNKRKKAPSLQMLRSTTQRRGEIH
jgi:hypothetical protein